jgi:hypothetical protein
LDLRNWECDLVVKETVFVFCHGLHPAPRIQMYGDHEVMNSVLNHELFCLVEEICHLLRVEIVKSMQVGIRQYYWREGDVYPLKTHTDRLELEVCEGLKTAVGLLNDRGLLSHHWRGFVADTGHHVLENHFVVADYSVGHLSLFFDLKKSFDCDLDFFVETGSRLFLLIYCVVVIYLWGVIDLAAVTYLLNAIDI